MNLINSNFEEWRARNPGTSLNHFLVQFQKASISGALFDSKKLFDVSRNIIAGYPVGKIFTSVKAWAEKYDPELFALVLKYPDYTKNILNIERNPEKPKKDLGKRSDLKPSIGYFYNELFYKTGGESYLFPESMKIEMISDLLAQYAKIYDYTYNKSSWFHQMKDLAGQLGFAPDMKTYRMNPEGFKGSVGDAAMILRIALTKRKATPELFEIMQVMGAKRVLAIQRNIPEDPEINSIIQSFLIRLEKKAA